MPDVGFTTRSFAFLEDLAAHNDRDWFTTHKGAFEEDLRLPFLDLLERLTERLQGAEVALRGNPKTLFRMNRDVRFSKDKSPYRTSLSALMTPSGTKSEGDGLLYLTIDAAGGFAAGGWYGLSSAALRPWRMSMVERPGDWDALLRTLSEAGRTLDRADALSAMPRGFEPHADGPDAEIVRLKSLIVREDLPKAAWTSGDVVGRVERLARDAMPLLAFGRSLS